jgi:hypothetical protein
MICLINKLIYNEKEKRVSLEIKTNLQSNVRADRTKTDNY